MGGEKTTCKFKYRPLEGDRPAIFNHVPGTGSSQSALSVDPMGCSFDSFTTDKTSWEDRGDTSSDRADKMQ